MAEEKKDADKRVVLFDLEGNPRKFEPVDAREALELGYYFKEKPAEKVEQPKEEKKAEKVEDKQEAKAEKDEAKEDKKAVKK